MLGRSNKRIAMELNFALGTVKTHVKSVLGKLQATSRTEAVAIAQRRGILHEERDYLPSLAGVARIGARPLDSNLPRWAPRTWMPASAVMPH